MRILFFGNNWVGWQIVRWLREQNENIVGLVIHPPEKRLYGNEIIESSGVNRKCIFDGSQIRRPDIAKRIDKLNPDMGISAYFGFILKPEMINLMSYCCINIHPALLPYNRGIYPNSWSIIDGTPAGVTIHHINEGIDTGDIIAQKKVTVEPIDTGESLYRKLEVLSFELFKETWPYLRNGEIRRIPQSKNEGTFHCMSDVREIDEIDLDNEYNAREFINILRARTFPPYPGAFFKHAGHKIYLRLQLLKENQLGNTNEG